MLIVLDPGHGGRDSGATGNNLLEKNINWVVANLIKDKLKKYDAQVLVLQPSCTNAMSTSSDELAIPVKEANRLNADFFLSIHTNAGGGSGFESFIYTKAGRITELIRNIIHDNVSLVYTKNNMPDRGKKRADFYVLRKTKMPAVLIENGFIDNAGNAQFLKDSVFINKLSNEIAYGMVLAFDLKVSDK